MWDDEGNAHSLSLHQAVATIGSYWKFGWGADRTKAYAKVLRKWSPDVIEQAVTKIAAESKSDFPPAVHVIADACKLLAPESVEKTVYEKERDLPVACTNPNCSSQQLRQLSNGMQHCETCNSTRILGTGNPTGKWMKPTINGDLEPSFTSPAVTG